MLVSNKTLSKIDLIEAAEYISYIGGRMSHLKLQKILFYVQAYHLAYFDAPLFDDDFQAWVHGPVSRKLYDTVKDLSVLHTEIEYQHENGKHSPAEVLSQKLTKEQLELINEVIEEHKNLTGLQLENMTHSELPWIEARKGYGNGDKCAVIISKDSMKSFYKGFLYGE